jgi:uncharacterized protein (TIGR00255 family)
MLKSMTAYGRSSVLTSQGYLTVEIQSINRKFLDLQVFLPKELFKADSFVRKQVSALIYRGQVSVRIDFQKNTPKSLRVIPNHSLIQEYLNAFKEVKEMFHLKEEFFLPYLFKQPDIFSLEQKEEEIGEDVEKALEGALSSALDELLQMKCFEGKQIELDLLKRVELIERSLQAIIKKAPEMKIHYKKKIEALLQEWIPEGEHEERILREVCLFSEKVDVEEEMIRFTSHVEQMKALFNENRDTTGKTLEFLVQELQREVNTIGAKVSDIEIAKLVLELKTEIERIREQIQNVE